MAPPQDQEYGIMNIHSRDVNDTPERSEAEEALAVLRRWAGRRRHHAPRRRQRSHLRRA